MSLLGERQISNKIFYYIVFHVNFFFDLVALFFFVQVARELSNQDYQSHSQNYPKKIISVCIFITQIKIMLFIQTLLKWKLKHKSSESSIFLNFFGSLSCLFYSHTHICLLQKVPFVYY